MKMKKFVFAMFLALSALTLASEVNAQSYSVRCYWRARSGTVQQEKLAAVTETADKAQEIVSKGQEQGNSEKTMTRRETNKAIAESFEIAVVERVNAARTASGMNPLTIDEPQCVLARQHSQRMAGWGMLHHAPGYAECIAQANGQADHVVNLWLNSPPHRSIIMSSGRKHIAVGRFGQWHTLRVW